MNKVQDMNVDNKTVLVRCDFNVTIKNNKIIDDNKIIESLETINYLLSRNCKVILLSHLGKVKTEEDKKSNSLLVVSERLSALLNKTVTFSPETSGIELIKRVNMMNNGDILLVENTRFEDIPNKLESENDPQLAMSWADLAELFVLDAFGSCHRSHASVTGITEFLPSCAGFLVQKEVQNLKPLITNPERPFTIIMGGAKIEDKILLVEKLVTHCDHLLIGGAIANTFLKALDISVGSSIVNDSVIEKARQILVNNKEKIVLPVDVIVGNSYDPSYINNKLINEIESDDIVYDVGNKTIERFQKVIMESKTVFVNGTMGKYEDNKYRNGTVTLLSVLSKSSAKVIVGGGDGVAATKTLGYANEMNYLSTGGGATLEYLCDKSLPGLIALGDK